MTYGIIKGLIDAGIEDFGVVQIDAHADLRDAYEGNPYSHASVMKRIVDLDIPLFQLGVRAFCQEERDTRKVYGVGHLGCGYSGAQEYSVDSLCRMISPTMCFLLWTSTAWIQPSFPQPARRFPVVWVGIKP